MNCWSLLNLRINFLQSLNHEIYNELKLEVKRYKKIKKKC